MRHDPGHHLPDVARSKPADLHRNRHPRSASRAVAPPEQRRVDGKLAKINTYHVQQLAYFLEKLQATPDGDGTLLDHLTLLYGCGISDSNRHNDDNLPVLVVGGGAGSIKGGRHVRVAPDTPLTNLQLTLLDKAGVPIDALGDSTGRVDLVAGV